MQAGWGAARAGEPPGATLRVRQAHLTGITAGLQGFVGVEQFEAIHEHL